MLDPHQRKDGNTRSNITVRDEETVAAKNREQDVLDNNSADRNEPALQEDEHQRRNDTTADVNQAAVALERRMGGQENDGDNSTLPQHLKNQAALHQSSITEDIHQQKPLGDPLKKSGADFRKEQVRSVVSPVSSSGSTTARKSATKTPRKLQPGAACYVDARTIITASPDSSNNLQQLGELYLDGDGLSSSSPDAQYSEVRNDQRPEEYVLVIVEPTDNSSPHLTAATTRSTTPVYFFDKWRDWNRTLIVLGVVTAIVVATLAWTIVFSVK